MEEDNLDLMLPAKKKKSKKVDFDEGDLLEKDDSKKHFIKQNESNRNLAVKGNVFLYVFSLGR